MKPQNIAQWTQREVGTLIHSVARYTRFVNSTKMVLVVLILMLSGLILFYPLIKNDNTGIRIAFTSSDKQAPSPAHMVGARYHGMDKDNQPYNVTATTARQRDVNTVDLDHVSADITLKGTTWLAISADTGVFLMKEHLLDLHGNVEMFDDQGYEFRTETMHVDVAQKNAVTHDEVRGQGPMGTLKATGAVIDGTAKTITFTGPIQMTLYPSQEPKTPQDNKS